MTILSDSSAALPADDGDRAASTGAARRLAADEHGFATCSLSSMAAPSVTAMYALFATANLILPVLLRSVWLKLGQPPQERRQCSCMTG